MNDINQNKLDERGWELLLEEINMGNVILIIGKELLSINVNGENILLKDYILREMCTKLGISYNSELDFSHLSYEYNPIAWKKIGSEPYYMTKSIVERLYNKCEIPSILLDLFSIEKFNTVITTTFDDFVYKAMEAVKGKGVVMQLSYKKHSPEQDISNMDTPVVYHMFGKLSPFPHEYVLTDDDLLEFMHCWLDKNYRPKHLADMLMDKYLLVIGCNYPNWLFRFFFHSLKYSSLNISPRTIGMLADSKLDVQLVDFLSRMNAGVYENAKAFVQELIERWRNFKVNLKTPQKDNRKKIFISYASEDYKIASIISSSFTELGFNVWFDRKALEAGDEYEKMIKDNIQGADAFIPILSQYTTTAGRRFFRREWKWATDELEYRFPDKFIYPISIDSVNMSDQLYAIFSKLHTTDCSDDETRFIKLSNIATEINNN